MKTAESDRAEKDGAVRVFYPAAGDTLWKVAKRYGKPVHTIAAANLLTEEQERASDTPASLAGVKKLMIF